MSCGIVRFTPVALLAILPAWGQSPPARQLPARWSYAAKFVCGWETFSPFPSLEPPLRHTEPGHYSTIVNVHNPWAEQVTILKKVVVSAQERQDLYQRFPIYPTIRFQETLASDQSLSVDCPEIANLLRLPAISMFTFREGFVVVEAFLPRPKAAAEARQLDVTTVTTVAAFRRTASAPGAGGGLQEIPPIPVVLLDQLTVDHEVTNVPGRLLPAGPYPEGAPPPPPPSTTTPPPPQPLALYVCNQFSLSASNYGVGYLTTHPQFCFDGGPGAAPGPPPDPTAANVMVHGMPVATDTGRKAPVTPWGANLPIYRCNFFNPLSAFYGIGVLSTHPQFCDTSGIVMPPGTPMAANQIGWNVGNDPVYRCDDATQDLINFYGIGILTTHPQKCDSLATFPPRTVPMSVATNTTLTVP